ncbi:hypothetical protein [Myxacorys almedinensis]|uniref:Uncharacterized protein n=1 Tax=Myxacorys almedinensis A TaxID=2690445 RepID=A0A8J8CI41_9CYAN|nr:hypothetical protein [Myxacorys almedinensis]NDJ17344.1 hypothetical protein [Myxacorys almedinensis A]
MAHRLHLLAKPEDIPNSAAHASVLFNVNSPELLGCDRRSGKPQTTKQIIYIELTPSFC